MKDIRDTLIDLLGTGSCTPRISEVARKTKHPSSTIHYNVKRLEEDGVIHGYRAIIDHRKAGLAFSAYVLVNLSSERYADPEELARDLAKHEEIVDIDICTGDWELVLKVRTQDMDAYYDFVKNVINRPGITRVKTLSSMREIKSEGIMR